MPAGKEIETEKFRVLELVSVRTGPTPKRVKSTRAGPTGANNADEYLLPLNGLNISEKNTSLFS